MTFARMAAAVGVWAWAASAGCGGDASPIPRPAAAQTPVSPSVGRTRGAEPTVEPVSPSDAVRQVNALRRVGRLDQMGRYVAEDRRDAVIELVRAVDQLIVENQALQRKFQEAGCGAVGSLFDRPGVANIAGVFSMDVRVVKEDVVSGSAVVTVQVGTRLPLERVHLKLVTDRWVIQPDPPIPGLAEELRNLGTALRRVGQAVSRQKMTTEQIAREMEFWQKPVLKRIGRLVEESKQDRRAAEQKQGE